ncbi:MAG: hypothetical protein AAGC81_18240 [Pseudomonadota bacterium]
MLGSKWRSRLERIESFLGLERKLLRDGRIEELAGLDRDRDRVAGWLLQLPDTGPVQYRRELERLRLRAKQNAKLFAAYIEGARSAMTTVTVLEEEHANLGAYARDGSRIEGLKLLPKTKTRA